MPETCISSLICCTASSISPRATGSPVSPSGKTRALALTSSSMPSFWSRLAKYMPLAPCLEKQTERQDKSVALKASAVEMSGAGAPCLTAIATSELTKSKRLPGCRMPSFISSAIELDTAIIASARSPARIRSDNCAVAPYSIVTWASDRFSNSGMMALSTLRIAMVENSFRDCWGVVIRPLGCTNKRGFDSIRLTRSYLLVSIRFKKQGVYVQCAKRQAKQALLSARAFRSRCKNKQRGLGGQ